MSTTTFAEPVTLSAGTDSGSGTGTGAAGTPAADVPLVVLLHGRGSDERSIIGLAEVLDPGRGAEFVAVRAPIAEGGGFAWFENRGIGRPVAESLDATTAWFESWLDAQLAGEETHGDDQARRTVVLVGFSGGAAFAGALVLRHPERYAGAAILNGTLPFDAGVPTTPERLPGTKLFVAQGDGDTVIPRELLDRTWSYATEQSGADVTTHRDAHGHGLTPEAVDALAAWLTGVLGATGETASA